MPYARTWPDAVGTVIDLLTNAGVDAYPAVPNPRPLEFAVVRRDGGGNDGDGVFDMAAMSVEVWSGDPDDSTVPVWAAASEIREVLRMAPETPSAVARVDIDSLGYLPDELSDSPRVIISCGVALRPTSGS